MVTITVRFTLFACALLLAEVWAHEITHHFGIYGGDMVNITEVPFMAVYCLKESYNGCGASIVNEQFLISAARCAVFVKQFGGELGGKIIVGTDQVYKGEVHEIEKTIIHPKYISNVSVFENQNHDYDITVIKLKKNLSFSERVQPIKMADSSLIVKDGDIFETVGFGATEIDSTSQVLLKVEVPYVKHETCVKDYQLTGDNVTERMICAGRPGKDSCQGDSGGPLRFRNLLIGVVSWGRGCGETGHPGVYAYIPSLRDFVDKTIKENQ